jgi:energy-coupling factor transporter ATP-binding protein EcfA2
MLETLLKLYRAYMAFGPTSPLPHLIGPPGCGKSTTVETLARMVGKKLHIINVSRLSPLETEGVQMPHGTGEEMVLRMLPATYWKALEKGDIVLLDEFLRGFPEVYNGLLDILTSRRAGAYHLPEVFIVGASNSAIAYDPALEDRLLHIKVDDPRKDKKAKQKMADIVVEELGLLPDMSKSQEMQDMLTTEVLPMFEILDSFDKGGSSAPTLLKGQSVRKLIGQAQLRHVQASSLTELIKMNNLRSVQAAKWQYMFLLDGKNVDPKYLAVIDQLPENKLSHLQLLNLRMNRELIEVENIRNKKEGVTETDDQSDDDEFFNL